AALGLAGVAGVRARQGLRVVRYQRNLRRLPDFRMAPERIPVSNQRLYLGRGFRWGQQHTQRLRDTMRPEVRHYVDPGFWFRWARRREVAWARTVGLRWLARGLGTRAWWNPLAPLPPVGGNPVVHAVEPDEQAVWTDLSERVGHTLVLGATRVGKTRLLELLLTQDIRRGDVVIVLDPKGDAELLRRTYVEARRAGRDFYLFHLGYPDISARYNPVGRYSRITEVATRATAPLPDQGNAAAFKQFGWMFINLIARARQALGQPISTMTILEDLQSIDRLVVAYLEHWLGDNRPGWEQELKVGEKVTGRGAKGAKGRNPRAMALMRLYEALEVRDPIADGLKRAFDMDPSYYGKISVAVLPTLEKLTTGRVAELIAPDWLVDDPRPIFDWLQVFRRRAVVYCGFDALTDFAVARDVGSALLADLTSLAGEIYKHGIDGDLPQLKGQSGETTGNDELRISLHADEVEALIGDEFVPLLNRGGGAGFQVTAYSQTHSDLEARTGSRAKAGQITGNFNTLIMLRVKELATAELLTSQLPEVNVHALTEVSGANDTAAEQGGVHFTSKNEDRLTTTSVPMVTPADVMALPKGQAFALVDGGQLWKVRFPLARPDQDPRLPADLAGIAAEMERSYRTGDGWWVTVPEPRASTGRTDGTRQEDA
ncbi:MAG: type IV conjugative transfer system coupling protein TraD, partial [Candidatus Competibacteraceae bacterium]|nr:type IV conjugative transfer system coupling protein TraD [Candidatus Competibacteraceae bacterium]